MLLATAESILGRCRSPAANVLDSPSLTWAARTFEKVWIGPAWRGSSGAAVPEK